jgi:uncharacterized protein (DUF433 family)
MSTSPSRYVIRAADIYGGEPIVAGTRVAVRDIVNVWKTNVAPEQISDRLMQWVTPAQVFDALSFYLDNTAEIDEKIAWYEAHPLLNVPVELRCYPDWDEIDAFTAEYRQQRNAELDRSGPETFTASDFVKSDHVA